jgi:hypothetical protein
MTDPKDTGYILVLENIRVQKDNLRILLISALMLPSALKVNDLVRSPEFRP